MVAVKHGNLLGGHRPLATTQNINPSDDSPQKPPAAALWCSSRTVHLKVTWWFASIKFKVFDANSISNTTMHFT